MKKQDRWNEILQACKQNGTVDVSTLTKLLNASPATIRRSLSEMEDLHLIERYHGGARIKNEVLDEPPMALKSETEKTQKTHIALTAARLIKDNMLVYLDAGSTTYAMIDFIKAKNITIVTIGIPHLNKLGKANIHTIVLGGTVRPSTEAITGITTIHEIGNYHFDVSFIGVNGIHKNGGLTTSNEQEAMAKAEVIKHSDKAYVLANHTKFNLLYQERFANLGDVTIISDTIDDFEDYKNAKYILIDGQSKQ